MSQCEFGGGIGGAVDIIVEDSLERRGVDGGHNVMERVWDKRLRMILFPRSRHGSAAYEILEEAVGCLRGTWRGLPWNELFENVALLTSLFFYIFLIV